MARNLILMLEREIETSEGVRDEKVAKKREVRRQQMEQKIVAAGRTPNPLVTGWSRATERSLQFIRWYGIASIIRASGGSKLSN